MQLPSKASLLCDVEIIVNVKVSNLCNIIF